MAAAAKSTPSTSRDSLRSFDAYRDENGQNMSDDPNDVARPADLSHDLMSNPGGEAEAARIATGEGGDDATAATEAEVPANTIAHISDASLPSREELAAKADKLARKR